VVGPNDWGGEKGFGRNYDPCQRLLYGDDLKAAFNHIPGSSSSGGGGSQFEVEEALQDRGRGVNGGKPLGPAGGQDNDDVIVREAVLDLRLPSMLSWASNTLFKAAMAEKATATANADEVAEVDAAADDDDGGSNNDGNETTAREQRTQKIRGLYYGEHDRPIVTKYVGFPVLCSYDPSEVEGGATASKSAGWLLFLAPVAMSMFLPPFAAMLVEEKAQLLYHGMAVTTCFPIVSLVPLFICEVTSIETQ
jgi:hypothetical protein